MHHVSSEKRMRRIDIRCNIIERHKGHDGGAHWSLRPMNNGQNGEAAPRFHRCSVMPILNANTVLVEALCRMWQDLPWAEARQRLEQEDVMVTNKKDKDIQLEKVAELAGHVEEAERRLHSTSLAPAVDQDTAPASLEHMA